LNTASNIHPMPTQLRNKVIFLACIFAFVGLGIVIYREWVVQKPFAVILFVSENLSPSQVSAARLFAGGASQQLKMESFPHMALASARADDYAVADAPAAATALATGRTVNRGALRLTPEGQTLESVFDLARRHGRATGLVSNTPLTDPAPAAFYAKASDARDANALAVQLMEDGSPDVLLGGGSRQLLPESQGGTRRDGRDLLLEMRQRGFDIVRSKEELENTPGWRSPKVFGVFAEGDLAFVEEQSRFATQPRLADLVRRGIELLQFNRKGYLLVVHAGLAGRAAEISRGETLLREITELDQAVDTARRYAGENALIVVSGLSNTGGLRLNSFSFAADRGMAVLGPSSAGVAALTWSSGPGAPVTDPSNAILEAVAAPSERPLPVAEDSLVLASGPGSPSIGGFLDLTRLHALLARQL
jgi:alkaline phosphatase